MIERGKFLVTMGGCNDCHSPKKMTEQGPRVDPERRLSGQPADAAPPAVPANVLNPQGWMAMTTSHMTAWAGPWGVSFAANLTPDMNTGIGSWNDEMFIKAMRTGKHMGSGRQILPPMPWQDLGQLPESDLKAIFTYLKSLPAVQNAVPDPIPPAPAHGPGTR